MTASLQWQEYVEDSRKKKEMELNGEMDAGEGIKRCAERKGTLRGRDGREGTLGNWREETGRRGKMKGPENVLA